jgi:hypothetical protein
MENESSHWATLPAFCTEEAAFTLLASSLANAVPLRKETDRSIAEIAGMAGFPEYRFAFGPWRM